jgi:hypothetical protein
MYKIIFIFITGLIFTISGHGLSQKSAYLDTYQWKNRLILLFSPDSLHANYQKIVAELKKQKAELDDRKLFVFQLFESGNSLEGDSLLPKVWADKLRDQYDIKNGKITLVLIGKDGGEKLVQQDKIDLDEVFERIDAMPMRREEMRRKSK